MCGGGCIYKREVLDLSICEAIRENREGNKGAHKDLLNSE